MWVWPVSKLKSGLLYKNKILPKKIINIQTKL